MAKSPLRVIEEPGLDDWQRAMLFQNIERSQLSNERNFLNWVRTSLAFITLGFVVQRFDLLLNGGKGAVAGVPAFVTTWVPILFFVLGGVIVALGTWEFFRVRREIEGGTWVGGNTLIRDALIVTTLVFLLIVLAIFVVGRP